MKNNYSLNQIATDLTLVYGAESYIRRRGVSSTDADPEGRACLAAVIDMVLSSDKFYITLPGDLEGGESQLVRSLENYVTPLPKSAGISLKDEVEKDIADGFINFALVRGLPWFRSWLAFQLSDPIVVPAHADRLGGEWISDQGRNAWESLRPIAGEKLKGWTNVIQIKSLHESVLKHKQNLSDWDFPLCYAFDVYRRGWQYAEHVRNLDCRVAYLPHPLRQNSLESGSLSWAEVDMAQRYLWSWGDYFCHVLVFRSVNNI